MSAIVCMWKTVFGLHIFQKEELALDYAFFVMSMMQSTFFIWFLLKSKLPEINWRSIDLFRNI
ncbi:hypothetical protein C6H68_22600 [Photorhabdus luminescens]|nr:hypothetical protein C6H68_22600 [Photorhabdus luminescens]